MGKIISFTNQKGGVGKTTTAVNLAACLGEAEQKVLMIDFDPQGNASCGLLEDPKSVDKTIYDLICDNATAEECIIKDAAYNLDLIPADIDLSAVEVEFVDLEDRNVRLRNCIRQLKDQYDFIMIDCPPSLGMLTVNALTASDGVIIPVQCEYYALEGLSQVLNTIGLVKDNMNTDLEIFGLVFTMFDSRTNLSQQVVSSVKESLDAPVFETVIPRNIRLAEAPSYGQPITVYDPGSRGAESYRMLAAEVLQKV